ncbi:MAG: ISLre2 family transposase [Christensenellales bacterium]
MREILEKLVNECVKGIIAAMSDSVAKGSFTQAVSATKKLTDNLGVQVLELLCRQADETYERSRNRKQITIKDKSKTRRLLTELGEVKITRICYFDKKRNCRFFAVDEMLGLERRSRIETGLKSKIIEQATLSSYGAATKAYGVSRQTAHNLAQSLRNIELKKDDVIAEPKNVANVYIEADEDHIHLQNGRSAEVKLVYVHEGAQSVCKGRNQLQNVKYFATMDEDPDEIWNNVAQYVYKTYSLSNATVHVSGDGAPWIRYALNVLPRARYHIDKFHVQKSATNIAKGDKKMRAAIMRAVNFGNVDSLQQLCVAQARRYTSLTERRTISENFYYLRNNIANYSKSSRCSAEGHVSHVLSERMSSRPMGWSRKGADRMAKLRAFYFNGGNFLDLFTSHDGDKRIEQTSDEKQRRRYKNHVVKKYRRIYESYPIPALCGVVGDEQQRLKSFLSQK